MGFHWQSLGYDSAHAYLSAMQKSETEQLNAFVRFILIDKNLHDALQQKNWKNFARFYNGSAYQKNAYDKKLQIAYDSLVQQA